MAFRISSLARSIAQQPPPFCSRYSLLQRPSQHYIIYIYYLTLPTLPSGSLTGRGTAKTPSPEEDVPN
jgi:hypothetical protein